MSPTAPLLLKPSMTGCCPSRRHRFHRIIPDRPLPQRDAGPGGLRECVKTLSGERVRYVGVQPAYAHSSPSEMLFPVRSLGVQNYNIIMFTQSTQCHCTFSQHRYRRAVSQYMRNWSYLEKKSNLIM